MAINLWTRNRNQFTPGDMAEYNDGVHGKRTAVVQFECASPFWGDNRRMIYVVGTFTDGTTTVTNTWTSNAEITSYTRTHAVGAAHVGQVTFSCSGAPTRTSA